MPHSSARPSQTAAHRTVWQPSGAIMRATLGYTVAVGGSDLEDDMSPFSVRLSNEITDAALVRDWQLLAADGRASVFQSYSWLKGLVDHNLLPPGATPHFVTVHDADTQQPLALFPLQVSRAGGLATLEYLADAYCDTAMPLLARGFEPDATTTQALLTSVIATLPHIDVVNLRKMPPDFHGTPNPFAALARCHATADATFPVVLDAASNGFVAATSAYKTYQKQWRKLTRRDGIAFEIFETPEAIARAFDAMIAMRNARFDALAREDLLDNAEVAAFYRDMALADRAERVVSLAGLKVGDTYTAYIYMMDNDSKLSTVISAIDNTVGNAYAPGLILFTKIFERALEKGYDVADIGIGYMPYKTRFAPSPSRLIALEYGLTLRGALVVAGRAAVRTTKAWARENMFARRIAEKVLRRKIGKPVEAPKQAAPEEE